MVTSKAWSQTLKNLDPDRPWSADQKKKLDEEKNS